MLRPREALHRPRGARAELGQDPSSHRFPQVLRVLRSSPSQSLDEGVSIAFRPAPWRRAEHQESLLMRSKSGRYIAMMMPPTEIPRNRIMIGSIIVRRFATAWSTSSS